jgi:hypothetical protein
MHLQMSSTLANKQQQCCRYMNCPQAIVGLLSAYSLYFSRFYVEAAPPAPNAAVSRCLHNPGAKSAILPKAKMLT